MKRFLAFLAAGALVLMGEGAASAGDPARPLRVVIISEDGMRPDVLEPMATPAHVAVMQAGATARQARTIPESDTLPSHASMLSGALTAEHGLSWNSWKPRKGYIHVPTVFSIAHEHGLTTAMFVGKPKLRHTVIPGTVDVFERPGYLCARVARRAAEYFTAQKPDLMFVHFSDPDEVGHARGWMSYEYLRAVRETDRCLGQLLAAIDSTGLGPSTLIIVTADHGGHDRKHSGGRHRDVDLDIPWLARGPGIPPGTSLDEPMLTTDTAATALAALRLPPPPQLQGRAHFFVQ